MSLLLVVHFVPCLIYNVEILVNCVLVYMLIKSDIVGDLNLHALGAVDEQQFVRGKVADRVVLKKGEAHDF
jgi:hypothetical protein